MAPALVQQTHDPLALEESWLQAWDGLRHGNSEPKGPMTWIKFSFKPSLFI